MDWSPHFLLWKKHTQAIDDVLAKKTGILLDGETLTLADLVAVSRYRCKAYASGSQVVNSRMQASIDTLNSHLLDYRVIYGVNTACGGNADMRTNKHDKLQHSFLQHHQSSIFPETLSEFQRGVSNSQSLPEEVLRAVVLVRSNSLLRGHSAIRKEVINALLEALSHGIVPLIANRGSISASGDLPSLAYLGGLVEGNPDTYALYRNADDEVQIISSDKALKLLDLPALALHPKEGLAIMNGTSASTAQAALVLHDTHNLAILVQLLTAMTAEALLGKADNYDPFISNIRPHDGQTEVAQNLLKFVSGSKFCREERIALEGLAQDRYPLRTAPQWIGPQLEDIIAAWAQVSTELNSTTDNPLIDAEKNRILHGGNFQAASITSAMEKTRTVLVMLGRLLLAQSAELVNPDLNKGLASNLCADDPSMSFTAKGVDINMTAYFSELAFYANSVASHVQNAELSNQSVNSLALISARMTEKAVEILSMMVAGSLFMTCQALDLRARDHDFLEKSKVQAQHEFETTFKSVWPAKDELLRAFDLSWVAIIKSWSRSNRHSSTVRCEAAATEAISILIEVPASNSAGSPLSLEGLKDWKQKLTSLLTSVYDSNHSHFVGKQSTPQKLGTFTKRMYEYVRKDIGVPFHRGLVDHPALAEPNSGAKTVGTQVTKLFLAVREGSIMNAIKKQL